MICGINPYFLSPLSLSQLCLTCLSSLMVFSCKPTMTMKTPRMRIETLNLKSSIASEMLAVADLDGIGGVLDATTGRVLKYLAYWGDSGLVIADSMDV